MARYSDKDYEEPETADMALLTLKHMTHDGQPVITDRDSMNRICRDKSLEILEEIIDIKGLAFNSVSELLTLVQTHIDPRISAGVVKRAENLLKKMARFP